MNRAQAMDTYLKSLGVEATGAAVRVRTQFAAAESFVDEASEK